MPLTKSKGNMYPWVTHTHTHLAGECPHRCAYCYVQAIAKRFGHDRYTGPLRLGADAEFNVRYGEGRVIFVEHCQDLWANSVPDVWVSEVLRHCNGYPRNEYVFQTKNPAKYRRWLAAMPPNRILGCTIETDNDLIALAASPGAPPPTERINALATLKGERLFITIEPVLQCDPIVLGTAVAGLHPEFVNVGADSKGNGLEEPSADNLCKLLETLNAAGVQIREKRNLGRLLPNKETGGRNANTE